MAVVRGIATSLFVLACALGCASPPRGSALGGGQPAERGPALWTEYESVHFVVRTDVEPGVARALIGDLEGIFAVLEDTAFPRTRAPWIERINVIAFRRVADLEQIGPETRDTAAAPGRRSIVRVVDGGPFGDAPTIVLAGGLWVTSSQYLGGHLIERMFINHLSTAPAWLYRGVSIYYRSLEFGPESVEVGASPPMLKVTANPAYAWQTFKNGPWQGVTVHIDEIPPVTQIVAAPLKDISGLNQGSEPWSQKELTSEKPAIARAAGAWALVHMLLSGSPEYAKRLPALMEKVKAGSIGAEAWNAAYGDIDPARVEADFRRYLRRVAEKVVIKLAPHPPRPNVGAERQRQLSDGEVHLAFLSAIAWSRDSEKVMRHLDAARMQAPGHPELLFWEAVFALRRKEGEGVEGLLAAATDAAPQTPRYLRALFRHRQTLFAALRDDAALRGRLIEAADRLATLGESRDFNNLGWAYALVGLPDRGLPLASRAVQDLPACWPCFDTAALLLYQKGRIDEAIKMQRRAVAGMETSGSTKMDGSKSRLQCFEEAAAQAARDAGATPAPDCARDL